MNPLKYLLLVVLVALLTPSIQAQASKHLSHNFVLNQEHQTLYLELASDQVEIERSIGSRLTIETFVKINIPNPNLLNILCKQGRYLITDQSEEDVQAYIIAQKKTNTELRIKGVVRTETFRYRLIVPKRIKHIYINDKLVETPSSTASN